MAFSQHGAYKLWVVDKTVFAELTGAWNLEAAKNFKKDFISSADSLGDQWAHLVYLKDWEFCGKEVFPEIESLVAWCIDNGLKRTANVYPKSSLKNQFLGEMVVEEQGEFIRRIFDDPEQASEWLTQEGYPTRIE